MSRLIVPLLLLPLTFAAVAAVAAADFCSNGSSTRFFEQNLFRLTWTKKFAAMAIFNLLSSSRKKDFYDEVGKFQFKRFYSS